QYLNLPSQYRAVDRERRAATPPRPMGWSQCTPTGIRTAAQRLQGMGFHHNLHSDLRCYVGLTPQWQLSQTLLQDPRSSLLPASKWTGNNLVRWNAGSNA